MFEAIIIIVSLAASGIALYEFWLKRVLKKPEKSEVETKKVLTGLKQEVTELRRAVGEFQDYLDGIPETKNPKFKKLFDKGYDVYQQCKYNEAIDIFDQCLKLKIKDSERGALLILFGNALSSLGRNKDAEDRYQEALLLTHRIKDREGEATALGNIGLIYYNKGKLDTALKYHKNALGIAREIGYKEGEANQLGNIGLIYSDKGVLDQSLKYHKNALGIDREIGYKQGEAIQLGNIGLIYSDKGELDTALKYHKEALEINREIGYKQGEAIQFNNIGTVYEDNGDLDQSLDYYKKALEIFEKISLGGQHEPILLR